MKKLLVLQHVAHELLGTLNPDHFFPTLDAALDAFRAETGAEWQAPVP